MTLDTDAEQLLLGVMKERGVSFKQAINDAIRAGLGERTAQRAAYRLPVYSMGRVVCGDLRGALDAMYEEDDARVAAEMGRQR